MKEDNMNPKTAKSNHNQISIILTILISTLSHYHISTLPHYRITTLPHYRITTLPHYRITTLPHYQKRPSTCVNSLLSLFYSIGQAPTTLLTNSAASCRRMAERTFKPDLSISSLPSMALVPCKRTIIGTLISPILL